MISLAQPLALLAALPWLAGCVWFYLLQRRSVSWIHDNVAPRFRRRFTVYQARTLRRHILLVTLAGLALIFALANPRIVASDAVAEGGGRLLVILDGSASMYADDVEAFDGEDSAPANRFERARRLTQQLVSALPDYALGLVSYSGDATIHLPLTDDRLLVEDALHFVEIHNVYRNTGSSLSAALDTVLRFVEDDAPGLQVVLLGDGELPEPESYDDALEAIATRGIPVHTVTMGSVSGQTRVIYDFQDVVDKKEDKTVLAEYTTRRVDEHFEAIADRTDGTFAVVGADTAVELADAIARTPVRLRTDEASWVELAPALLFAFAVFFIWDALAFGYGPAPASSFRIYALGDQGAPDAAARVERILPLILLMIVSGCGSSRFRAHVENEKGIGRDALAQHDEAEPHYLRAIGFNFRPEIPMVNLGRSKTLAEAYSEAHQHFEQALLLAPRSFEAHFNDGVALYEWGESVRDPRHCDVERTLELWRQSVVRFGSADELASGDGRANAVHDNLAHLETRLAELEAYRDAPPPECDEPPPPPPEGAGGNDQESEDDNDDPQENEDPEQDENDESEPPPPGGPPPEPPPDEGRNGGGGQPPPMSESELQQIRDWIEELRQSRLEEGKYYRGSRDEQFSNESWKNPDRVIKW